MERDPLQELLASADGLDPGRKPLNAADIRRTARRRVRRTRLFATTFVLTASASAAFFLLHHSPAPTPTTPAAGQAARQTAPPANTSLNAADPPPPSVAAQIDMLAQTITDRRRARERMQGVEPVNITDEREDAARTMVMIAPLRAEVAGAAEARSLYERTIALYPDTQSAAAARLELARLQPLQ